MTPQIRCNATCHVFITIFKSLNFYPVLWEVIMNVLPYLVFSIIKQKGRDFFLESRQNLFEYLGRV